MNKKPFPFVFLIDERNSLVKKEPSIFERDRRFCTWLLVMHIYLSLQMHYNCGSYQSQNISAIIRNNNLFIFIVLGIRS